MKMREMNGSELTILLKQLETKSKYTPENIISFKGKDIEIFSLIFRNLMAHQDPRSYSILDLPKSVKKSGTLKKRNITYFNEFIKTKTVIPRFKEDFMFKTSLMFYYECSQYRDLLSEFAIQLDKEKINEFTKEFVRKLIFEYMDRVSLKDAMEFLKNKIETIIELSVIQSEFREDLMEILSSMLDSENNSTLVQKIKENIMNIHQNFEEDDYNIILLKFLDILIENSDASLKVAEKLQFFKYLAFLKNITQKDIDKFYEFIDTLDLKTIFRPQIEDDE